MLKEHYVEIIIHKQFSEMDKNSKVCIEALISGNDNSNQPDSTITIYSNYCILSDARKVIDIAKKSLDNFSWMGPPKIKIRHAIPNSGGPIIFSKKIKEFTGLERIDT